MKSLRIEIICIGSELLSQRVNSHTVYLGQKLAQLGCSVAREHTVGDDKKIMAEVFKEAYKRADVIISCGGLGPTFDDLTRDVWSKVTGRRLLFQKPLVDDIREKFRMRGNRMPYQNRNQGYILKGAEVIPNHVGTAPGQFLATEGKLLVLLPGPKNELAPMVEEVVIPRLSEKIPSSFIKQKSFHLVGVSESQIDQMIRPLVSQSKSHRGCHVIHSILASESIVTAKFQVEGPNSERVTKVVQFLTERFRRKLSRFLFGEDEEKLEEVVGNLLRVKRQTLAVAESCTGGLIAKMLTDIPGSSDYFQEGLIPYSNKSKIELLNLSRKTLDKHGAVSEPIACEMALNLRRKAKVHYALSVTGIAGPNGGSPEKPVGLVYIGCAGPKRVMVESFRFRGDRSWIRMRSSLMALEILRKELRK